jgi:hypothetical protein
MKKIYFAALLFWLPLNAISQELECDVQVDVESMPSNVRDRLKNVKPAIYNYMNFYRWTNDAFTSEDKIRCGIQVIFTVGDGSSDNYSAQVIISSSRPVYKSMKVASITRIKDTQLDFTFPASQTSLTHNELRFDPLASFLDYYAYIILGYDYDTFSELGGTLYFEKARRIASIARSGASQTRGWQSSDNNGQNRATFIDDVLDPKFQPLRLEQFNYHYNGLDEYQKGAAIGRAAVLGALQKIADLNAKYTRSFVIPQFFQAKYIEIGEIFKQAPLDDRRRVYEILIRADPADKTTYDQYINIINP